jgi:RNA polymerase subunit RPABC4/transcription elongation factor Spt4
MEPFAFISILGLAAFGSFMMGRFAGFNRPSFPQAIRSRKPQRKPTFLVIFAVFFFFAFLLLMSVDDHDARPFAAMSLIAYWMLLPAWVYADAKQRRERAWAWGLMTLFTNVMGLISYLIIRPDVSNECKRCGYKLKEDFVVCPYCGPEAGRACSNCHAMLELDWVFCPYCRASVNLFDTASSIHFHAETSPQRETNSPSDAEDGPSGPNPIRFSASVSP